MRKNLQKRRKSQRKRTSLKIMKITDEEESNDEEVPAEIENICQSTDGNVLWSCIPPSDRQLKRWVQRGRGAPEGQHCMLFLVMIA